MSTPLHKNTFQEKVLGYGIVAFLAYIPFHPFFTAWVGSLTDVYAPIKVWKDLLVAAVAITLVGWSLLNFTLRKIVWRDPLNLAILGYVFIHFILFLIFGSFSEESYFAGLIFNLRFLAFFMVIRVFLAISPHTQEVVRKNAIRVLLGGAFLVSGIALVQLIMPTEGMYELFGYDGVNTISPVSYVDNDPSAPRAFSTLRGPNELGAYLIIPITLTAVFIMRGYRRWYILALPVLSTIALIGSYSRSALIGCLTSLVIAAALFYGNRITRRHRLIAASVMLVMLIITIWLSVVVPQFRLFVYHSSPGDSHLFEGSTEDHFRATARGVNDVVNNPLGRGPGESGPASFYQTDEAPRIPENYYIQIAQEVGIFGLISFITILVMIGRILFKDRSRPISLALFASFIGLTVTNLFLHTWADDPVSYLWWGMAALMTGYAGNTYSIKKSIVPNVNIER